MPLGYARSILTKAAAAASENREPETGQNYSNSAPKYQYSVSFGGFRVWWNETTVYSANGYNNDGSDLPASVNTGGWTYYKGTLEYDGGSFGKQYGVYRIED